MYVYSRHGAPSAKINHISITNPNERSILKTFSRLTLSRIEHSRHETLLDTKDYFSEQNNY